MEIILTHPNADFDAVASLLAAHRLYPQAVPVLPEKVNRNVAQFLTLYKNGLPFVAAEDADYSAVTRVILVDTQNTPQLRHVESGLPMLIIDHHPRRVQTDERMTFTGDEIGATTTLLVEQLREQRVSINSLEATLMALGVYSDTGSLTYGRTTARDIQAAAWLLEQKAVLDTVRRFLIAPLDDVQQTLLDKLVKSAESRSIEGLSVVVCYAHLEGAVPQVNSVTQRVNDILDPDVLVVLVNLTNGVQMVCRSGKDALDVGELARHFGGNGHPRASAARITRSIALEALVDEVWAVLVQIVQPSARVADLMSYGVQTVQADARLGEIIQQLRRIGHEGYPVLEDERVVGLLTRRDADRALEHGMGDVTVREVMLGGDVALMPDDSVAALEQLMVQSGWGQIPVVDAHNKLIGIVTRTDLIKHWVSVHPTMPPPEEHLDAERIATVLGAAVATLIQAVADHAHAEDVSMYMVGGVVRDLLLNRPNYDIDFVVEGDAIAFAESLEAAFGGEVNSFRPFGTAKWRLDETVLEALSLPRDVVPDHIDFATSRNEFYEHPTALPSVYNSSIKLDLHRRDFTINTLAVQLSPRRTAYRLLDFYGGLDDLRNGVIRVLHSLSFIDDPTRVLRAVRFEKRLDFHIEPRTQQLIETAHPMLQRITGERLRNELTLLLKEDTPERGFMAMEERDILAAIHPDFSFTTEAAAALQKARQTTDWPGEIDDWIDFLWHLVMAGIPHALIREVGERLLFSRSLTKSFIQAARLLQVPPQETQVSALVYHLEDNSEMALLAAWLMSSGRLHGQLTAYLTRWRHIHTVTNGNTLKAMGLPPGPHYREILTRLRTARLDGEVTTDAEEQDLLEALVKES